MWKSKEKALQALYDIMNGREVDRLFTLAVLASTAGQYEQVTVYARKAVATAAAAAAATGASTLSRTAFDRLTVAYKSLVDNLRIGWRTLDRQLKQCEDKSGDRHRRSMTEYAGRLARETVDLCRDFCTIIDHHMLPGLDAPADKAHVLKLKADFYRYTYEVSEGGLKEWSATKACRSYQRGYDTLCRARCSPLEPVRLDLAVNFAVCLERIFGTKHAAAFVRRVLDDTLPAADRDGEGSKSLRDLRNYLTNLDVNRYPGARDDDDDLDISPGFCTSDTSDTEPEF